MKAEMTDFRVSPISEHAVCISGPEVISIELHQFLLAICERLREANFNEIDQIVPAYHTITIILKGSVSSIDFADDLREWFESDRPVPKPPSDSAHNSPTAPGSLLAAPPVTHLIPVKYGGEFGPDLDEFAKAKGMSLREVIDLHTSVEYYVYMIGFTAGFPYLGGLPEKLHHARRREPRVRVPAGSVGIGGAQTGVYPSEAPGGWYLIGRTDLELFDIHREHPALIKPGDKVRFVEVSK
jgi:inhibitor of KinA